MCICREGLRQIIEKVEKRHQVPPQLAISSGQYTGANSLHVDDSCINANTNQPAAATSNPKIPTTNTNPKNMLPNRLCNRTASTAVKGIKSKANGVKLVRKQPFVSATAASSQTSSMPIKLNVKSKDSLMSNVSKIVFDNESSSRTLSIRLTDHDNEDEMSASLFLKEDSCENMSTSSHYSSLFTR